MQISRADRISSSAAATPELRAHIEEIRERIGGPVPTADHILTVVAFLLEVDKGSASHFDSYIATLPRRDMMNQTGWYWAAAELECVVPRHTLTNVQRQQATLRNLRTAMKQLSNVPPLSRLSSDVLDLATWGSLLVETRGFHTIDGVSLQPILDMANHDPTQTVSPFSMKTGTDYLVATRDIQRGGASLQQLRATVRFGNGGALWLCGSPHSLRGGSVAVHRFANVRFHQGHSSLSTHHDLLWECFWQYIASEFSTFEAICPLRGVPAQPADLRVLARAAAERGRTNAGPVRCPPRAV